MKKSENLGLNLPEDDDFFDVEHQNENMRKLDENKTIVENNQITTVAGHAADARQLNKSIEGTFAYLINSDLLHRALISEKAYWKAILYPREPESTMALVAARIFTIRAENSSALYFVTFVQKYTAPFVLPIHQSDDITMTTDIIEGERFELNFSSSWGTPTVTVLYLN